MPEPDRTDDAEGRPLEAGAADAAAPESEPADTSGAALTHRERRARFQERRAASGRHVPAPWFRLRGQTAVKLAVVLSFVILLGVMVAKKVRHLSSLRATLAKNADDARSNSPPARVIPARSPGLERPEPASLTSHPRGNAPTRPASGPPPMSDLPAEPPAEVVQVDHTPTPAPLAIPDPPAPGQAEPTTDLAAVGPQGPASRPTASAATPDLAALPDLPEAVASSPRPDPTPPHPVAQVAPVPQPEPQVPAIAPEPAIVAQPVETPPASDPPPVVPKPAAEVAMQEPGSTPPETPRSPTPTLAAPAAGPSDAPGKLPDLGPKPSGIAAVDGPSPSELVKDRDPSRWIPLPNGGPRRKRVGDLVASPDRSDATPPGPAPSPAAGADPHAGSVLHVVREGEDFGTIARDYYTSSRFRKALWAFNRRRVPSEEALTAGTTLVIPMPEALDAALVAPPGIGSAPEAVGSRGRGRASREGNPREVELMLPVARPVAEPVPLDGESARRPTCIVRQGETLRSIARQTLGDPHREGEILDLNRRKIPNPRHLTQGLRLALPDDADTGRRLR